MIDKFFFWLFNKIDNWFNWIYDQYICDKDKKKKKK